MSYKVHNPKRLDLEFSLFLGSCVALLLGLGLFGGLWLNEREHEKSAAIERAYIDSQLGQFKDRIMGDVLLEHHEALKAQVEQARHSLNLNRLTLKYGNQVHDSKTDRTVRSLINAELPLVLGPKILGSISYESGSKLEGTSGKVVCFIVLVFFIFIIMLSVFVSRWLQTRFFEPIRELIVISGRDDAVAELENFRASSLELDILREQFRTLVHDQKDKQEQITELEKRKSVAELAAQVAHDIRSPLTALNVLMLQTENLPEDVRSLMRAAATRIRDIANNLLTNSQSLHAAPLKAKVDTYLLSAVVESMVSEKRVQYREKSATEVTVSPCKSAYGLFAEMDVIEFRRVLSNLINNAVESYGPKGGPVTVSMSPEPDGWVTIDIKDEGRGISPDVLPLLGSPGVTHGKKNGYGLGVSHSKKTIESWGGRIDFITLGKGTLVRVWLKQAQAPIWFLPELKITVDKKVVILDDDEAVHHTWDQLLAPFAERGVEIHNFRHAEELESWLDDHCGVPMVGLFDHELIGQGTSGLEIIERHGLQDRAVLVTSRFEEKDFLNECRAMKIKVIPKGLVNLLPLKGEEQPHV